MADLKDIREELVLMAHRVGSQKVLAAELGIPETVLSLVIRGHRKPADSLLRRLGYEAVTVYRKKTE